LKNSKEKALTVELRPQGRGAESEAWLYFCANRPRSRFDRGEKNTLLPNFTLFYNRIVIFALFSSIKTAHQI
jgi:hypothetical protein